MVSWAGAIVSSARCCNETQRIIIPINVVGYGAHSAMGFRRRREQVAAAANGADDRGVGWVRLDLAADAHDPQVDRAVEGLRVAGIGELEQPFAREHPPGIGGKHLEQAVFRGGERVLVSLAVAQRLGIVVEPFGAEADQVAVRPLALRGRGGRSRRRRRRRCAAAPSGCARATRATRRAWRDSRRPRARARPPGRSRWRSP